jgi:hypothetical protein
MVFFVAAGLLMHRYTPETKSFGGVLRHHQPHRQH